jgi:hypothetical protein
MPTLPLRCTIEGATATSLPAITAPRSPCALALMSAHIDGIENVPQMSKGGMFTMDHCRS